MTVGKRRTPLRAGKMGVSRGAYRQRSGGYVSQAIDPQRRSLRRTRPAIRHKDLGIWQTWTWAQVLDEVRAFSVGLERARPQARRQDRHHRHQPAAALLGDVRGAGARRGAGAGLCRCGRRRDGLRARTRRGRRRGGRGPGAGRQAPVDLRPAAAARLTSSTTSRAACATTTTRRSQMDRRRPGGRARDARRRSGAARALGRRWWRRQGRRSRDHPLHLGHHRPSEGRDAHLRQRRHLGAQRQRIRQARRERGGDRLSAARLGRRPHLLLRAVLHRRLLRQLPGSRRDRGRGPPRDRHHLCLRAAAHLREPADAHDGAHGGREHAQARDVPLFHRRRAHGARRS